MDAEREARVSLAACYRLVAKLGLDDLIYNHISMRLPGREDEFLLNPYGLLFEEITASSLVRIDTEGRKLDDAPHEVNVAAFVIHAAIHKSRPDAVCVLHTHSDASVAVSGQQDGLLPLSQFAMRFVQDMDEAKAQYAALKQRLPAFDRSPDHITVLPGVLPVVGRTPKEARDKLALLQSFVNGSNALQLLSDRLGQNMTRYDLDGPVPEIALPDTYHSFARVMLAKARRENMTLRDLYDLVAAARGH